MANFANADFNSGMGCLATEDFVQAIEHFQSAGRSTSDESVKGKCHLHCGLAYQNMGDFTAADNKFRLALTCDPSASMKDEIAEIKAKRGSSNKKQSEPVTADGRSSTAHDSSSNNNINIHINAVQPVPAAPASSAPPAVEIPSPVQQQEAQLKKQQQEAEAAEAQRRKDAEEWDRQRREAQAEEDRVRREAQAEEDRQRKEALAVPVAVAPAASGCQLSAPPAAPPVMAAADPRQRGKMRWGDGVESPSKAGARPFIPSGWSPDPDMEIQKALEVFGTDSTSLAHLLTNAQGKLRFLHEDFPEIGLKHIHAVLAYTEENPHLYPELNRAMRTQGAVMERRLQRFLPYIFFLSEALQVMPRFEGTLYRGIDKCLPESFYEVGKTITWQQFSSTTKSALVTLGFLHRDADRKLSGSMFVCRGAGRDISELSHYPSEEEVLFSFNTFWKVVEKPETESAKKLVLGEHFGAYDVSGLDVYVLQQIS